MDTIISSDASLLDIDAIHAYLSRSYWAKDISRELVERSIQGALCFGVYTPERRQIGFARVITDRATFGYLSDVYILEEYQGAGIGKQLVEAVMAHPDLQDLRRFVLVTLDAQTLYEKFGFAALASPETYMEIVRAGLYPPRAR